jgi:hypothetical protein
MIEILSNPPGISRKLYNRDAAFLYVITLVHNGHADWRFPTPDEWVNSPLGYMTWHQGRIDNDRFSNNLSYRIYPVRDL